MGPSGSGSDGLDLSALQVAPISVGSSRGLEAWGPLSRSHDLSVQHFTSLWEHDRKPQILLSHGFHEITQCAYQKRINKNGNIILYMTKSVSTLYQKRINAIHETASGISVLPLLQLRMLEGLVGTFFGRSGRPRDVHARVPSTAASGTARSCRVDGVTHTHRLRDPVKTR